MTSQSIIGSQATTDAPVDAKAPNVERRGPPVAAGVDNEETLAWVEHSLKRARHQEQARLTGLLEAVQAEVTFELKLLEAGRVSCGGLARSGAGLRRR
jgi:hypothetical protein